MKKFVGDVILSDCDQLIVKNKLTWVHIYYENNDAPLFKEGQTITVKSKLDFLPTYSTWTNEHGKLITDRVRGRYYMYSDGIETHLLQKGA